MRTNHKEKIRAYNLIKKYIVENTGKDLRLIKIYLDVGVHVEISEKYLIKILELLEDEGYLRLSLDKSRVFIYERDK